MEPSEDAIRACAHEIYVQSGCLPGRDLDNWLEARRRLEAGFDERAGHTPPRVSISEAETRRSGAG